MKIKLPAELFILMPNSAIFLLSSELIKSFHILSHFSLSGRAPRDMTKEKLVESFFNDFTEPVWAGIYALEISAIVVSVESNLFHRNGFPISRR